MKTIWLKYKRTLYILVLLAGLFFLIGFIRKYHVPRLKQWALVEIEKQTRTKTPARIWPQDLEFHLFPVGVTLKDVKVLPQSGLESQLAPFTIEKLKVTLSTWGLIKGEVRIGEVVVNGADAHIILRKGQLKKSPQPLSIDILEHIPLNKFTTDNVTITVLDEASGLAMQSANLRIEAEARFQSVRCQFKIDEFKIKRAGESSVFESDIEGRFLFDKEGMYFSSLQVKRQNSYVVATGSATGDLLNGELKNIKAKVKSSWNLEQITQLVQEFKSLPKIPEVSGHLTFETDIDYTTKANFNSSFLVNSENLKVNQYRIGHLYAVGKINEKNVTLTKATLRDSYGAIDLNSFSFNFDEKLNFQSQVAAENVDLYQLLTALGLPNIPVYTKLTGKLPCTGHVQPQFGIDCQGKISGQHLSVKTKDSANGYEVVNLPEYNIIGSVQVDQKKVTYKTDLEIGQSKGTSSGVINYQEGFKILYDTAALNFSDIKNLSGLNPKGQFAIKGSTSGTSKAATIDLQASGDKASLYDYALGRLQFKMNYKSGVLDFTDLSGLVGESQYTAKIKIDLGKDEIDVTANSNFLNAEDLPLILQKHLPFKLPMTGTGSATFAAEGALDLRKLNYKLRSSLFRGTLYDESYDQIQFDITNNNSTLSIDQAFLKKGRSVARADGRISADDQINVIVIGRGFQVEQSENLNQLKIDMSGNLDFDINIGGNTSSPNFEFDGHLTKVAVGDVATSDSNIKIKMNDREIKADADFIGKAASISFIYPLVAKQSASLNINLQKWNFAQSFSMFSDSLKNTNYQTNLTGELNMSWPRENFQLFEGKLKIDELFLRNNRAQLTATKPMRLIAKKGIIETENFEINGDDSYLRLKSIPSSKLNLQLEGRLDLSLLSLFTPFLDDLRGPLSLSLQLEGPINDPTISGSAFIESAFIKLKGFPHPFEQLSGDTLFTKNRININAFRGRLGGGAINGNGQIQANSLTDVRVNVRGEMNDVKLNVPEGFSTRGSGEFFVKGSWFPYTVGAIYNIDSGNIERKGTSTTRQAPEVKPSQYLPKFLSAQRFSPIVLDLDVNMPKEIPVKMLISRIDIRAGVTGQVKVAGPPENPLLSGRVNISRGSKVIFRNNTFEISNGLVDYKNSPPENPNLNIQAQSRVVAQLRNSTREYDIDLRVTGAAQDPQVSMFSEPALAESELLSLLTLGFISEGGADQTEQESTTSEQLANTSYQIGSAFLNEQLGINRALESRFGVQFDFNSSFDSIDNAEKHKFTLRKQWTPKFGMTASRAIGKSNTNTVRAEYKLNKNVSVVGEWEGKESAGAEDLTSTSPQDQNLFGLDIEFRVEFK